MSLSCGAKVLKYCLFAFNLVFFIAGIICLVIGIYFIVDENAIDRVIKATEAQGTVIANKPHAVHTLGVILAIAGAIIIVIAFLGCCGAVKEWRPLLVLYGILLMIILAVEIAAAIYAAVNRNNLQVIIKGAINTTLISYNGTLPNDVSVVRATWDAIMEENDCCGLDGKIGLDGKANNDFVISGWYKSYFLPRYEEKPYNYPKGATGYYPKACCKNANEVENRFEAVCPSHVARSEGCYGKLKKSVEDKLAIVIGVAVAVGLIQLIGIVFAFGLCRAITNEF